MPDGNQDGPSSKEDILKLVGSYRIGRRNHQSKNISEQGNRISVLVQTRWWKAVEAGQGLGSGRQDGSDSGLLCEQGVRQ